MNIWYLFNQRITLWVSNPVCEVLHQKYANKAFSRCNVVAHLFDIYVQKHLQNLMLYLHLILADCEDDIVGCPQIVQASKDYCVDSLKNNDFTCRLSCGMCSKWNRYPNFPTTTFKLNVNWSNVNSLCVSVLGQG